MELIPALRSRSLIHWLWCAVRQNVMVARVCDKGYLLYDIKEVGGGRERCESRDSNSGQQALLWALLSAEPSHWPLPRRFRCYLFHGARLQGFITGVFILMVSHLNGWHSGRYFALKSLSIVAGADSNPHFLYQQDQRFLSQQQFVVRKILVWELEWK